MCFFSQNEMDISLDNIIVLLTKRGIVITDYNAFKSGSCLRL